MTYPGGKNGGRSYHTIINQIPPHDFYVEGFAGSGAIFRRKELAARSALVDLSDEALEMCKTLERFHSSEARNMVEYFNTNSLRWLEQNERLMSPRTFVYLDPPYLHSTRSRTQLYEYEMTNEDHERLLSWCLGSRATVMISGYRSDLYEEALRAWRTVSFDSMTRGGTMREEVLWMNYDEPRQLHDYRYLGSDFREREKLKRRRQRLLARLKRLPRLESLALVSGVEEYVQGGS